MVAKLFVRGPARGLAVLTLWFAFAGGCDGPAVDIDAGAERMDASGLCVEDLDCDDGRFCNGAERCAPGAAGADARGCTAADPATPCAPTQTCDEAAEACRTECAVEPDADGDGSISPECDGNDCDDADPLRYPGAIEICDPDARDEDCDPSTFGFRDADGDAYADGSCCNVDATGDRICGDDCNDARPNVHPALAEACDELDNDCDGATDEGVTRTFRPDVDRDGYGAASAAPEDLVRGCVPPPAHAESDTDCDDTDAAIHPGALEQCDVGALDENCDGTANPGTLCSCSGDVTRSCATLAGVCAAGTERCIAGSWGLCSISPTPEVCNGVDDDCDGTTDELLSVECYPDGDNDGYAQGGAIAAPTCPVPGRDAFAGCPPNQTNRPPLGDTGIDCNDANSTIHPGTGELCDAGMVDENCDGSVNPPLLCACTDGDSRSCSAPGSCGSGVQTCSGGRWSGCTVSPVAESCNSTDDDCDGSVDEDLTIGCYADGDNDGHPAGGSTELALCPVMGRSYVGGCPTGFTNLAPGTSTTDCNDASAAISPAAIEQCDAAMVDENCDGAANPAATCACSGSAMRACTQPGICASGTQTCAGGSWGLCSILPATEVCNGIDDDCDGSADEMLTVSCYSDGDNDGYAASGAASTQRCTDASRPQVGGCPAGSTSRAPGAGTTDCNDANAAVSPGTLELCNGVDDNCAGGVDEGVRTTFYRDVDGDGFGTASMPVPGCSLTTGHSTLGTDCNDANASVNPAALERCDTIDNNCDMSIDPGCACTDGATRACTRSGVCASGIESCSAGVWGACSISPTPESCNGLDDDCDGTVDDRDAGGLLTVTCWDDGDDDGYALSGTMMRLVCPVSGRSARGGCPYGTTNRAPSGSSSIDCDDASDVRHPGAPEICNGASEDCDASIDEGLATYARYRDTDGDGREGTIIMACDGAPGTSPINNDCDETSPRRLSVYSGAPELCDRYDNNCDGSGGIGPGQIDPNEDRDGDGYMPGGFSLCTGGTLLPGDCNDDPSAGGASDRPGAPDLCDTRDNDCDGVADEDPAADASCPSLPGGYAGCSAGSCVLVGCQAGYADCDANGANGCEVDTRGTPEHCGGCGLACAAGGACISGVCDAPIDLDVSTYNTCWLYASGRVGCIGNQVGLGTDSTVPVPVPGASNAVQLATYHRHSCVVVSGGTVACWGHNADGAVGSGAAGSWVYSATTVPGLSGVAEVGVGRQFSCARLTSGAVRCWGDNQFGQLGDGTTTDRAAPVTVMLPAGWVATDLELGGQHACAIAQNGAAQRLYCWGANSDGQLGNGTTGAAQTTPVQAGTVAFAQVAVGDAHTCGIQASGALACWGDNATGQTGTGDMPTDHTAPASILTIAGPVGLVAGGQHACAWQVGGAPRCWGENSTGQLGNDSSADASTPVFVQGLPGAAIVRMRASLLHTCAELTDGDWYCWGYNLYGQLGDLTTTQQHTAVPVVGVRTTADVATGYNHSCVRESTGEVQCWGRNSDGQIGSGVLGTEYGAPRPVPALSGVAEIGGDANHTIARLFDGTLRAWGDNASGQLGDGTTTDRTAPVPVSGVTGAIAVDVGTGHACAVLGSGALSCWGQNASGQLGDGSSTTRTTAVTSMLTGVTSVSCGGSSTCATTRSGQLYCWGANDAGQLGTGTTTPSLVPVAVPGMIDVVEVTVGSSHACARRADGQVRCWGANAEGQLGDGTRIGRLSPTAVGSLGALVVIGLEAGYRNTCALVEDGSMRCWGDGVSGQIGDGGVIDRLLPRFVVGGSVYRAFALGSGTHVCASEVAFGVECWGTNAGRQLGDGTNTARSTPTQVQSLP